jgi:uncharacterized protein YlxP (DUF503 family)
LWACEGQLLLVTTTVGAMAVGYCTVELRLPENGSLKGKRQVLRSLIGRVQARYNVSIAEIEDQDSWKAATLGISCVSTSGAHAHEMLEKVVDFIQGSRPDAEFLGYNIEIIHP